MSEVNIHSFGPKEIPNEAYYYCRYKILERTVRFLPGSEILNDDGEAIHAFATVGSEIVGVGRIHLIPAESDGHNRSCWPGAAICPPFSPLITSNARPAVQIRQMGVLASNQRHGTGSKILKSWNRKHFLNSRQNTDSSRPGKMQKIYQSQG